MSPLALTLRAMIVAYQWLLAPLLPMSCRFAPSCSHYAAEAVAEHGGLVGGWLALRRLVRCHPWGGAGYDPVPKRAPAPGRRTQPAGQGS